MLVNKLHLQRYNYKIQMNGLDLYIIRIIATIYHLLSFSFAFIILQNTKTKYKFRLLK